MLSVIVSRTFPEFKINFILDACRVITATFQTIEADQLIRLLGGISEAECLGYCKLYKWEKRSDGTFFIKNHEATIKSRNVEERVKFERKLFMTKIDINFEIFRMRRCFAIFHLKSICLFIMLLLQTSC